MPRDHVDDLLADLDRRLRGSSRLRRSLLAEARAGLHDAERRYVDAGMDGSDARARAAAEFGDPAELAPAYQAELAAAQGRHNAMVMLLGLPGAALLWKALWWITPRRGTSSSRQLTWVMDLYELAAYATAIGAVCGMVLLVSDARWVRRPRAVTVGTGAVCLLAVLMNVCATTSSAIFVRSPLAVVQNSWLAVPVYLATWLALALTLRAAWRSMKVAAPPR